MIVTLTARRLKRAPTTRSARLGILVSRPLVGHGSTTAAMSPIPTW